MTYFDERHREKIKMMDAMWSKLDGIEELASEYQIGDIAQDNNLKLLQTLVLFDFKNQPGREGSDAIDRYGHEWELKTVNIALTKSFSTNHHTNHERIAVFRKERWMFSAYKGISLQEVYVVHPEKLERFFKKWEEDVQTRHNRGDINAHLNNPKIPLKFVQEVGVKVYPFSDLIVPLDPAEILKEL